MLLVSRTRLAAQRQEPPAGLERRIQARLRDHMSPTPRQLAWSNWIMAVAAMLIACLGTFAVWTFNPRLPSAADSRDVQDRYIQTVSNRLGTAFRPGLGDHLHCGLFVKRSTEPASAEQMAKDLGPEYLGLLPLVTAKMPANTRIISAHKCKYKARQYVHFVFSQGPRVVSVILTRQREGEGESFESGAAGKDGGLAIYQAKAGKFDLAGFESSGYLGFVVSERGSKSNLEMARNLVPELAGFLRKIA